MKVGGVRDDLLFCWRPPNILGKSLFVTARSRRISAAVDRTVLREYSHCSANKLPRRPRVSWKTVQKPLYEGLDIFIFKTKILI